MSFKDLANKRFACRKYTDEPVSKEDIEKLYMDRKEKYTAFADETIDNNGDLQSAVREVLENL